MDPVKLLDYASAFRMLSRHTDLGVLLVTPERELEFMSDRAKHLLRCPTGGDRVACWHVVRPIVEPVLEKAEAEGGEAPTRETVQSSSSGPPQQLRLEVHAIHGEARQHVGHLVLVRDHSTFQRFEQSLHLAMHMHHTNRLYRKLAHDLRQPIGAILIHLKVLEELDGRARHDESDRAQLTDSIEVIRNEVKALDESFQLFFREIALSESGADEPVPLREIMRSALRLIKPQVEKAELTLHTEITKEDFPVRGHRFRIKQAILNLAINAIEAMSAGILTLRLLERDGWACIEVVDEGPGIPEDVQARMFERHYTTKEDSLGLGLYLVKQTVRSHGGRVGVRSTPGDGTTVELLFPLYGTESAPSPR